MKDGFITSKDIADGAVTLEMMLREADDSLSAGQLFEEMDAPLMEGGSRVIPSPKGKMFAEDGSMEVAIIRPCISRGKRIRGLPPIYETSMLQRCAEVFTGWPMYMDHLMAQAVDDLEEELAAMGGGLLEYLQERARSIKELGGRVVKSEWRDGVTFEDDDEFGYQPGAVVGTVIPQPGPREMLEADPGILHVSINAWPSGARAGNASWDPAAKGMVIEGIRRKPMGSVDWVFRGGAGGRPIPLEEREVAASLLEAVYSAPDDMGKKLSELKPDQLREYLQEQAPHLVEALPSDEDGAGDGGEALSESRIQALIEDGNKKLLEQVEEKLEESTTAAETRAEEIAEERDELRGLQAHAFTLLEEAERNGLPSGWVADLKRNYTLHPSGPAAGLVLEEKLNEDDEPVESKTQIEERVKADVQHAVERIRESGGDPRITGLGANGEDPNGSGSKTPPRKSPFRDFMRESGRLPKDPEKQGPKLVEMVTGEPVTEEEAD